MLQKLTHLTLFVHNQTEALDFYLHKLGFKLHTDVTMEPDGRWLTICLPDDPHLEIVLMPAITDVETALVGKQGNDKPFLCFSTSNCKKTYEELKVKGVEFISEPQRESWGTHAIFKDLYGTLLLIIEPSPINQ